MKIFYIAGGNYKSFYINCFLKLKYCDYLIFNFGIIYDLYINNLKSSVVIKELMFIANKLNCIILAGVNVFLNGKKLQAIISCNGKNFSIKYLNSGAKIITNNKTFVVGTCATDYKNYNKIILSNKRIYPNLNHCVNSKIYLFCDSYGATIVKNKKLTRKFNKCSKIILK